MMPQAYSDAFYAFAEEHELDIDELWPDDLQKAWDEKAKVLLRGVASNPDVAPQHRQPAAR